MGRPIAGLGVSLLALAAFAMIFYGLPLAAALGAVAGSVVMLAVLIAHLWAREWREARRGSG